MNCADFWDGLREESREWPDENQDASAHLAGCPECALLFAQQERLLAGLRMLKGEERVMEAPGRVESNLIEAFRKQHGGELPHGRRWWWMPALSWAAAGVVLAGLTVLFRPAADTARPQPAPAHRSMPNEPQLASAQAGGSFLDAVVSSQFGEGFIPLPNAPQIGPNEDINVVRMELPRAAMIAAGLDVSPDRVSEPVEADVVLGGDGLARAVRFLDGSTTF